MVQRAVQEEYGWREMVQKYTPKQQGLYVDQLPFEQSVVQAGISYPPT